MEETNNGKLSYTRVRMIRRESNG